MPMPPPEWGPELDTAFAAGDEQALSAAYRHCAGVIRGLALRALRDDAGADDVVQEVFIRAWKYRSGYRPEHSSAPAWLIGIARNCIADAARTAGREAERRQADAVRTDREPRHEESDLLVDRLVVRAEVDDHGAGVLRGAHAPADRTAPGPAPRHGQESSEARPHEPTYTIGRRSWHT